MVENLEVRKSLTEVYAPILKAMRDRWSVVFGPGTYEWAGFNSLYQMVEERNGEIIREENKLKARGESNDRRAE